MKKSRWKPYVFWILLSEAAGVVSAFLTRAGAQSFRETVTQPPLSPPGILFPVVWTILYALMGIGAARISSAPPSAARTRGLLLFLAQLAVNFLWSPVFFNARAFGLALLLLLLLWMLVFRMIRSFAKTDPLAAYLQIPHLLWLTFAAYLSAGVWLLNR